MKRIPRQAKMFTLVQMRDAVPIPASELDKPRATAVSNVIESKVPPVLPCQGAQIAGRAFIAMSYAKRAVDERLRIARSIVIGCSSTSGCAFASSK